MKTCFIGHRDIDCVGIGKRLEDVIENEIKRGCKNFAMGTHGDFDNLALSVCRKLRHKHKDMQIEVVLTSLNSIRKKVLHDNVLGKDYLIPYSDVLTTIYDIEETYFKRQIIVSNQRMIDTCDTLICYVNKKHNPSGAKYAMNYAKRRGIKVINLFDEKDELNYGMTKEEENNYYKTFIAKLDSLVKK